MDLSKELKTNSNFRKKIIEMDILEIKNLLELTLEEVRLLKFQSLIIESGENK